MEEDKDKFDELTKVYGNVLRLGAVEDAKNREKLAALVRFPTTQRNNTSLDEYLENKKQGQKQVRLFSHERTTLLTGMWKIFYLADMGKSESDLAKSVFVEKLHARGYEVFLLGQPLDEVFVQNIKRWKYVCSSICSSQFTKI